MREFTEEDPCLARSEGHVTCRCVNHPEYRWFQKDPRTFHRLISQNIGLHFLGDLETGRPACPFQEIGKDPEGRKAQESVGFSFECDCPYGDLEYQVEDGSWLSIKDVTPR